MAYRVVQGRQRVFTCAQPESLATPNLARYSAAFYHIINVASGTAVSANQDGSFTFGWSVNSYDKQLWTFEPYIVPLMYRLRLKGIGYVHDLSGGYSADRTPALAWSEHSIREGRNQLWWLENREGSEGYTIHSVETGTVLDLSGGASGDGTPIWGFKSHGGRNQQWKMDTVADDYQKITNVASGTVMDASITPTKVTGWKYSGAANQQWLMATVPCPGPGWVLIQNRATGKFLSCNTPEFIGTADGPETVYDESVQWRFLQKEETGFYCIVNRATGYFLHQNLMLAPSSVSMARPPDDSAGNYWFLENYKQSDSGLVCIISGELGHALDHYYGKSIQALDGDTDQIYHSWKIMPANDWLTSFALINGETGLCLSAQYAREETRLSTVTDLNDLHAQWVFRKVAEGPLYSIQNKANNHIIGGSWVRWELVVCCEKYFGVRDHGSGKYLAIENGQVTFQDANMSDRHQCWELTSGRTLDDSYDLVCMDDDLLEVLLPFLGAGKSDDMKHRIEKRSPKKPAKDKNGWSLPTADRVNDPGTGEARALLEALINQWEWDVVNEEPQQIQTLISFNAREARDALGQPLPQIIQRIYNTSRRPATVFRIDRQGYLDQGGQRCVNIQGQYGKDTYFHIVLSVGVRYGREQIRRFMRDSLARSVSIVITPTTCKPPSEGPPYRRDPGAGGGNSWIRWAIALLTVPAVVHSEL
ncbi:ricin B lectin domain-containing protein [Nemania sp. FL0916]|nr:ricin B lectin domain-containing protein [Nemania sp. FL0916]